MSDYPLVARRVHIIVIYFDMYWTRVFNQYMLYLVGLLSGTQVEYKPVDLQSYEARNGASLASVDVSPVEIDAINPVLRAKANLKRDRKSNDISDFQQINLCARRAMVP